MVETVTALAEQRVRNRYVGRTVEVLAVVRVAAALTVELAVVQPQVK